MQFIRTEIGGLILITPRVFKDERGLFFETYNKEVFVQNGIDENFVQDNQSFSVKGVLRGLHFQRAPFSQGKLVSVIQGRVMDVAVDIRKDSSTFGRHLVFDLNSETKNMVYIPPGFAHGFIALEDSIFSYKCTNLYNKTAEDGIIWNDMDLNINWEFKNPIVSSKDQSLPSFKDYINFSN